MVNPLEFKLDGEEKKTFFNILPKKIVKKKLEIPNRFLIREGEMTALGEKRKTYWFFLFNDLMLWAKPQMNNKFKFKGEIDLHKAEVVSRSQTFSEKTGTQKKKREIKIFLKKKNFFPFSERQKTYWCSKCIGHVSQRACKFERFFAARHQKLNSNCV